MSALQRSPFKLQITPSHEYQEYYTVQAIKQRSKLLSTSLVAASSQAEPSYSVLAILQRLEPHRVRLPEVAHQVQLLSVHSLEPSPSLYATISMAPFVFGEGMWREIASARRYCVTLFG
jgi:hypothetical protein